MSSNLYKFTKIIFLSLLLIAGVLAQDSPVLWEQGDISSRDLFYGPGGREMLPDVSKVTFEKEETEGYNKKYRIKDANGRKWIAKLTRETQSEVAAVRLVWALGYKTEINYFVPSITIPGKGTFKNVRLEARPENIERLDEWKWEDNPFTGTNQLQGLKIMMVFLKNWDIYDLQNKVLKVQTPEGVQTQYIISDLGGTLGRLGNNNFPLFYRLGRSIGKPEHYADTKLIKDVDHQVIELEYKGKNRQIFEDITVGNAKWLYNLMSQLSDKQIADAFRAANYKPKEVKLFVKGVKDKIKELGSVANGSKLAEK